jgi:hypothetical protein
MSTWTLKKLFRLLDSLEIMSNRHYRSSILKDNKKDLNLPAYRAKKT